MLLRPCKHCGTIMRLPPSRPTQVYCSLECRHTARYTTYTCKQCGVSFEDQRLRQGRTYFCSKQCMATYYHHNETEQRACTVCGTSFQSTTGKSRGKTTCSPACANIAKAVPVGTQLKPRVHKVCPVCAKPFDVLQCRADRIYCSHACAMRGNTGKMTRSTMVSCDYCGRQVKRPNSRQQTYGRTFCNTVCFHKWDALYKSSPDMLTRLAERIQAGLGKPSKLEDRIADWLTVHNLVFDRQVPLKVYSMDFKVGATYIEVQGCYWHGCPDCFPLLTPRQRQQRARDKSKATYCRKRGIPLLVIWEHDVKALDFSALSSLL